MSLQAQDISVQFGGVRALNEVSFSLRKGEVASVVGPNGAGKTTLFNCLTGFVAPSEGRVLLNDSDVSSLPPHERARAGIARTFQTPRFDPAASVRSAVALGAFASRRPSLFGSILATPTVMRLEQSVSEMTDAAMERVGLALYAARRVGELSLAQIRLLEVARAIVGSPTYVLLDEPAAGIGAEQRHLLADTVRAIARDGMGVMLVEHNLGFVASVSDRIAVLHRGTKIFEGSPSEFKVSAEVRSAYIGMPAGKAST